MYDARVVVSRPGADKLDVESVALPSPRGHQVLVSLLASGICHSQLHQMERHTEYDVLLGHEGAGTVVEVGVEVTDLRPGDQVLVTWIPRPTGARRPEPAVVELSGGEARSQNVFTWASATLVDEAYVVKVDHVRPEHAVIACAVMTGAGAVRNTARVQAGETVAVIGLGGVGLSAVTAARVAGASMVIGIDLQETKLELAREFGATHVVNAATHDPVETVRDLTRDVGRWSYSGLETAGTDFAFDCIGLSGTMAQAVAMSRLGVLGEQRGGTAVLVGAPTAPFDLDVRDMLVNEKRFIGSLGGGTRPAEDLPLYVGWSADGTLDLDALVTDRVAQDDINEGVAALREGRVLGRAILMTDSVVERAGASR